MAADARSLLNERQRRISSGSPAPSSDGGRASFLEGHASAGPYSAAAVSLLLMRGLVRVNAGRHPVAIIRLDRGGTAGESREHDDGAECGKKNGSHN
jgi:hypothetical protein